MSRSSAPAPRAWLLYSLLVAVGVYLMWSSLWDLDHLISSLGHAFVIAGLLAFTVDTFAKRHILQEMSRDIYQFLIGHGLPPQLQQQIREVMQYSLVRHDYAIRYRFLSVDDRKVKVEITEESRIKNYGGSPRPYKTYIGAEAYEKMHPLSVECWGADAGAGFRMLEPDLPLKRRDDKPGSVCAYADEIVIPAGDIDVRVRWRYTLELPSEYRNVHSSAIPFVGASVEVEPHRDLEFSVDESDQCTVQTWTIRKAFIPGHPVVVRWSRKTR